MLKESLLVAVAAAFTLAGSGCGAFRESMPPRSAAEQMLLSTAADRAVESMPTDWLAGRMVFVDASNLDCYDKPYVLQRIRQTILNNGGRLADSREEAQAILEAASGGFSVDKGSFMIGVPETPIPVPFAVTTIKFPELALFKLTTYAGRSKMLFSAVDPSTGGQIREIPICYGNSRIRFWTFLLVGPIKSSDVPEEAEPPLAHAEPAPARSARHDGRSTGKNSPGRLSGPVSVRCQQDQISTGSHRLVAFAAALPQMWQR